MEFGEYARYEQPVEGQKLGRSVLEVIELAEQRLGVDPTAPDYVPVYDQH